MKHLLLTAFLAFGLSATAQDATQTLVLGNGSTAGATNLEYVSGTSGVGFAQTFTRYKMRAYRGCQIQRISIEADSDAEGTLFISKGVNDTPLYTQPITLAYGWNTVTLDTPYDIDGQELTFGYTLTSCPSHTLTYGRTLVEGTEYVNRGTGWERFTKGSARLSATLTGDNLPAADVALGAVQMPPFVRTGDDLVATAEVVNLGTATVKEVTMAFRTDTETYPVTVEGLNIKPRASKQISVPLTLTADGDYSLWLEATAVNGLADAAPIDNTSARHEVFAREAFGQRNVLLEIFSTERCTNCPEGHATIEAALGDKPNVIAMTHHAGFFDDQWTIPESVAYEWFYKSPEYNTTYAPGCMTDRTPWQAAYPEYYPYNTPVVNPSRGSLTAAYGEATAIPALAVIDLAVSYDEGTRQLTVDVDAEALVAMTGYDNPALNVFVVEDRVPTSKQENTTGIYYQRHVVRRALTPTWGLPMPAGGKISEHFTTELGERWKPDDVTVIAFVANYNAKDNADCRVMNSAEINLRGELSDIVTPELPAPATPVYNLHGQRVTTPCAPGLYIQGGRKVVLN